MKLILPIILAVVGLGAGVGAGLALKPKPEEAEYAAAGCGEAHEAADGYESDAEGDDGKAVAAEDCDPAKPDPFAKAEKKDDGKGKDVKEMAYVPIEKPFVVPVFAEEQVTSMVVVSLSVETDTKGADVVSAVEPRLRDRFLKVMFLHSNSGGFDGSFTSGRRIADLKSALLKAAQEVLAGTEVSDILITEIARQDV